MEPLRTDRMKVVVKEVKTNCGIGDSHVAIVFPPLSVFLWQCPSYTPSIEGYRPWMAMPEASPTHNPTMDTHTHCCTLVEYT